MSSACAVPGMASTTGPLGLRSTAPSNFLVKFNVRALCAIAFLIPREKPCHCLSTDSIHVNITIKEVHTGARCHLLLTCSALESGDSRKFYLQAKKKRKFSLVWPDLLTRTACQEDLRFVRGQQARPNNSLQIAAGMAASLVRQGLGVQTAECSDAAQVYVPPQLPN